jgi:cytochrome P450
VDTEVGGVKIPAGAKMLVLIGSANHDPEIFADPGRLDIHRPNAKEHIAFGYGAHICIGAPLARLEVKVVLEEVAKRFPGLRLASGQKLRYLPNTSFRGPRSLRVEWDA